MIDLRRAAAERHDGSWELLATCAGAPASVEATIEAITNLIQLKADILFEFDLPDFMVRQRIEALAAWNPDFIAEFSTTWPPIGTVNERYQALEWDLGQPILFNLWRTALRHLITTKGINPTEVDVP